MPRRNTGMVGHTGEILFSKDAADIGQSITNAVVLRSHPAKASHHDTEHTMNEHTMQLISDQGYHYKQSCCYSPLIFYLPSTQSITFFTARYLWSCSSLFHAVPRQFIHLCLIQNKGAWASGRSGQRGKKKRRGRNTEINPTVPTGNSEKKRKGTRGKTCTPEAVSCK